MPLIDRSIKLHWIKVTILINYQSVLIIDISFNSLRKGESFHDPLNLKKLWYPPSMWFLENSRSLLSPLLQLIGLLFYIYRQKIKICKTYCKMHICFKLNLQSSYLVIFLIFFCDNCTMGKLFVIGDDR